MKKLKFRFIWLLFWQMLVLHAGAQDYSYYISSDTISYPIGGRIMITHEWSIPESLQIEAPALPKNLEKLELLELGDITTQKADGKIIFRQQGIYTCFDSGYYQINGLPLKVGDDSIFSNPLFIQIRVLPVDTSIDIRDIEAPLTVPYTFAEMLPYIGGGLLLAAVIFGIWYWRKKYGHNSFKPQEPPKPPHVVALAKLEKLKNDKLWQSGREKEYHFALSEILREYISRRYNILATDLTTHTLIAQCHNFDIDKKLVSDLRKLLEVGDLVKFAKGSATPEENEACWEKIHQLVTSTVPKPVETENNDKEHGEPA